MAGAKIIVNCSFIFRLSFLNMGFNKSRQNKKFVYWPSSFSLPVLNMTSKQRSRQVMKSVNCLSHAEYGPQTRLAPTEYFLVLALVSAEYVLESRLAPSYEIRVLTLEIHSICAECELET